MLQSTNAHGSGAQKGAGGAAEEGEDQEDPSSSSSSTTEPSNDNDLESFRAKWRSELKASATPVTGGSPTPPDLEAAADKESLTDEEKARQLFMKGVENEQLGKLYEAIQFYKKAVQLVPDIEFRLYESTKNQRPVTEHSELGYDEEEVKGEEGDGRLEDEGELEDFDPTQSDLTTHLQRVLSRSYSLCQPKTPQPHQVTHISALPVEIVLYVLRWVVSSDLDLRSLETCSAVCRGFYLCSRDPEIWRLACVRVWGVNCGGLTEYKSWREMFITRPRLHFNGCYISKTTYVRSGENSFQDQFYRPWHFVQYYRYLRFFPEGRVLMLTTADEPLSCLGLLKTRQARHPAVMVGHFRLTDDRVTLTVHKQDGGVSQKYRSRYTNRPDQQTFHLEFEIVRQRGKSQGQLRWRCYSVFSKSQSGYESSCPFEVVSSKYPPLWFSRVKSYTAEADFPLM